MNSHYSQRTLNKEFLTPKFCIFFCLAILLYLLAVIEGGME